jgi:adenosylcobinamide kinase/adenosylcobinamide-phosphate guanylyltransferase
MIPYGDEGRARIEKHRRMRSGKGFETLEAPFDAYDALTAGEDTEKLREKTVLLECVSNLTANELFERHRDPGATADKICEDIKKISETVRDLIIVSNHFEMESGFDEETAAYVRILDIINDRLGGIADRVIKL